MCCAQTAAPEGAKKIVGENECGLNALYKAHWSNTSKHGERRRPKRAANCPRSLPKPSPDPPKPPKIEAGGVHESQDAPKSCPQAPKRRPRSAPEAPRSAQEAPKTTQEAPKSDQEAPQTLPNRVRRRSGAQFLCVCSADRPKVRFRRPARAFFAKFCMICICSNQ